MNGQLPEYSLSFKIIKGALNEEQFDKLMKLYVKEKQKRKRGHAKGRGRTPWAPTTGDWKKFNEEPAPTLSDWTDHWGVHEKTAERRLGRMALALRRNIDEDLEQPKEFLGVEFEG